MRPLKNPYFVILSGSEESRLPTINQTLHFIQGDK